MCEIQDRPHLLCSVLLHHSSPFDSFGVLDIRLQEEVKDQNMDKHPLGIYHSISTLYADLMMNSVTLCISYGRFQGMLDHGLTLNLHL